MKYLLLLLLAFFSLPILAQEDSIPPSLAPDSLSFKKKTKKKQKKSTEADTITIKNYKLISYARDTTYLDTTLTMAKEYRYNYLRRDDFELMPFANIGRPYNSLGVDFERERLYPTLGAKAKHFKLF